MMSSLGRDDSYTDRLSIDENGDTVLELQGERLDLTGEGGGGGGGEGGGGGGWEGLGQRGDGERRGGSATPKLSWVPLLP